MGVEKKNSGGLPSHAAYFKENVVTRTPAVHRKAETNIMKKNSGVNWTIGVKMAIGTITG
jgi:hypothetical protein